MRTKLLVIFSLLVAVAAKADVGINETNFPDEKFRAYLLNQNYGRDGVITGEEISKIVYINITDLGISDLSGIQIFTELHTLECDNNRLTTIDLSNNPALISVYCNNNLLTSIDVTKNPVLNTIACHTNQITSLDITHNPVLETLVCYDNLLTSLDVSHNLKLKMLWCSNNNIGTIDISNNTALTSVDFTNCMLKSLDISKNTLLNQLGCASNQLTSLNVSNNKALTYISCYDNQIKDAKMDELVNSMPIIEKGRFFVILEPTLTDGNVCTTSQVEIAQGKGWTVYDSSMNEYRGSDSASKITTIITNSQPTTVYDLNGRKSGKVSIAKGVYLVNGRKVVTR